MKLPNLFALLALRFRLSADRCAACGASGGRSVFIGGTDPCDSSGVRGPILHRRALWEAGIIRPCRPLHAGCNWVQGSELQDPRSSAKRLQRNAHDVSTTQPSSPLCARPRIGRGTRNVLARMQQCGLRHGRFSSD